MTDQKPRAPLFRRTIDIPTILTLLVLGGGGLLAWGQLGADVATNATAIANVKINYTAAISSVRSRHQTDIIRVTTDVDKLDDNMTVQAVSLGKIEANQENILRAIQKIGD